MMTTRVSSTVIVGLIIALGLVASPFTSAVAAQESQSAALAKELVTLMQEQKIESMAARSPAADDQFVAALYFPAQLLVVSARYSAPPLLNEKLARSEYRDVYIDLNSAAITESKILITDSGADGLKPRRMANQPFDSQDIGSKGIRFDGNWRANKMSEQEYMKIFAQADENYAAALRVLISAMKKNSVRATQ